jgi:DegV family protein with EDD domain
MPDFKIFSDSSCDLPESWIAERDITLIYYYVTVNGGLEYLREYKEINTRKFYDLLRNDHIMPKTSLPPIQDYLDAFRPALQAGKDVLCICLTSKFSGSFQSAYNAYNILADEFPNRVIKVIDSKKCTIGQGILVLEAGKMRDQGYTLDEIAETLEKMSEGSKVIFTVDSLEYLQRGGRIGKVTAFAGALLNIKPIIIMFDGELNPIAKVRGRQKAMREIVSMTVKEIGDKKDDYYIATLHSDCLDDLKKVDRDLETRLGRGIDYTDMVVGATIGTHIGPTVVGIGYIPKAESFK